MFIIKAGEFAVGIVFTTRELAEKTCERMGIQIGHEIEEVYPFQETYHVEADKHHKPVPDDINDPHNCVQCGLAVTADAKFHGFDDKWE